MRTAQYAYFFAFYTCLNAIFYTANGVAYSTLPALSTNNAQERVQLGSIRFMFAVVTNIVMGFAVTGAVESFGGGAKGWRVVAIICALIGLVVNTISCLAVKEVGPEQVAVNEESKKTEDDKLSFLDTIKLLFANKYYIIIVILYIVYYVMSNITTGSGVFFAMYVLGEAPYIAVERVDKFGKKHSKTPWMLKDNISSWTWRGYEGKPANVDVYSPSEYVELFLNGQSLGREKVNPDTFTAAFQITYQPGELKAVGFTGGLADGEYSIATASDETGLHLEVYQNDAVSAVGRLAFISISHTDKSGVKDQQTEHDISVKVEGNGSLLALGSANPSSEENYFDSTTRTFDGCCMAVVAFADSGNDTTVEVVSDGAESRRIVMDLSCM